MKITVGKLGRSARRGVRQLGRLTWACALITMLIVTTCLPVAATVPHPGTVKVSARPGKSMPMTTSERQVANDLFAQLPLGFEAQATEPSGQFLARTDNWNVYLTGTEAALTWRSDVGVGPLGRSAYLGLPRNAGSLQANEQLPEPRCDRVAPRDRRSTTIEAPTAALRMQMIGANPRAHLTGEQQLATQTNYFIGNDAKQWRTQVPSYARVKAMNIYPGIDAVYYGDGHQLEYDFDVAPQANAKAIRLRFASARDIRIDESGDLVIATAGGEIRHHQPLAYQMVDGLRREIAAEFVATGKCEVGFALGAYNHNLPLVIDPIIDFASSLADTSPRGIALDPSGNIYITGVISIAVPASSGQTPLNPTGHPASQPKVQAVNDNHNGQVVVAKLDPSGSTLIYLTYLGGSLGASASGIAVDAEGSAYITGSTFSTNLPVTPGAFQTVRDSNSSDAFVTKLSPSGATLAYSTYLGGNGTDNTKAIALDTTGNAYVTGFTTSSNFPLRNPFQSQFIGGPCSTGDVLLSCSDGFITKVNTDGTGLVYSSFIGGSGTDESTAIAVDSTGSAFITGNTTSPDWPVTPGAFQPTYPGGNFETGFVAKVNAAGAALDYSTYLGGTGKDGPAGIAVDSSGSAHVTGVTTSTDFPVTDQALQPGNADNKLFRSTNGGGNWQAYGQGVPGDTGVNDIVIDPVTPTILYATTSRGIYKSTNGGANWRITAENNDEIIALAIDPKNPLTLYASVFAFFSQYYGPGVVKSTDGGESWSRLFYFDVQPVQMISSIVIDPQTPNTLYVGAQSSGVNLIGNILKSTDGGQIWTEQTKGIPLPVPPVSYLAIAPGNPQTIYANAGGLYRSVNGGLKWKPVATPAPIVSLAISSTDSNVLYGATGSGVLKSVNRGKKWQELTGLLATANIQRVWLDPTNPSTVYAGGQSLFKSTDAGATWTAINTGLPAIPINMLEIDPQNPATLYVTNFGLGYIDAFVTRLNATGSGLIFSTYLGGSSLDIASAITLDAAGNAYIVGSSSSPNFPLKDSLQSGPHQRTGGDAFVTELDPAGTLLFSSWVGISSGRSLALDQTDGIYILGQNFSTLFLRPVTLHEFGQPVGLTRAIIVKITEPAGNTPAPLVTAISPNSGVATGGTAVTISGSNFLPGAQVYFDSDQASDVQVVNSTTIQAKTPNRTSDDPQADVVVVNPDGQRYALVEAFNSISAPVISGVSFSGKDMVVTGTAFDEGSVILINGVKPDTTFRYVVLDREPSIIGRKLGRQIKRGQTVIVTVRNSNGLVSAPLVYTRP